MNRIYGCNDEFFGTWSKDMAYVLGLVTSDGSVRNDRSFKISLKTSDENLLYKVKDLLSFDGPVRRYSTRGYHMSEIVITSPSMCGNLMNFGVTPNKTYSILPPGDIPSKYVSSYVRGLFDGDGGISSWFTKTSVQPVCECTIDSASKELADRVLSYLVDQGIAANLYVKSGGKVPMYRVRMCGESVVEFGSFIYTGAKVYMERKRSKYMEYCMHRMGCCESCGSLYYKSRNSQELCGICLG